MVKESFSSSNDQNDPKEFRESFGSFGTTTRPGANQLTELQTKIRQGVKHVELHLASKGKGQFGQQDVPDKYGFEQRRTIMQLAKLNNQTLSVHGSFDVTSFSGMTQSGFNEAERWNNMREIDETLKFAAETAKGGAVVFHIQGDVPSSRGELNVSKEYLDWMEEKSKEDPDLRVEYDKLKRDYFNSNPLNRRFVDNIEQEKEVRGEFAKLSKEKQKEFEDLAKKDKNSTSGWEEYFKYKSLEKNKVSPDHNPLVVVGDKIASAPRQQEMVDYKSLNKLDANERDIIKKKIGIENVDNLNLEDYQKLNAVFTNGKPEGLDVDDNTFKELKEKILLDYTKVYNENNYIQSHADKEFYEKLVDNQIFQAKLQKKDLDFNLRLHKEHYGEIKRLEKEERRILNQIDEAEKKGDKNRLEELRVELNGGFKLNDNNALEMQKIQEEAQKRGGKLTGSEERRIQEISESARVKGVKKEKRELELGEIGQLEYQKLEKYDESVAQINEQINKFKEQKGEIKSITDESFKKNTTAMGHLGTQALRYQLDLIKKAEKAEEEKKKVTAEVRRLQEKYDSTTDVAEQNKIHANLQKERYKLKGLTGLKDYKDIDLIERPLYLAPENMLPGYGSLTSIEEFKASVRMSQQEFANKILSEGEEDYVKLREEYNEEYKKRTGENYFTGNEKEDEEKAMDLAKRHIGGTFDNAHAAVWMKHFKREKDEKTGKLESEEHRIQRFNKWLNDEAASMYKEGIIKHVHFNDTSGKDDDHNLLGQGVLDIHDLRQKLRDAGMTEALIVEAGGRGADSVMHLQNAWDIFNPSLFADSRSTGGVSSSYKIDSPRGDFVGGSSVSDWMTVRRNYETRPQYSQYGFGYNSFRHQAPQNGNQRGGWSGTGFL